MLIPLAITGGLAGLSFLVGLYRWRWIFLGLLLFLPFSGILSIWLKPSPIGVVLKDIIFVIPLYVAFFLFHLRLVAQSYIPRSLLLGLFLFAAIVLVQALNPNIPKLLVPLIGAKVWLMYIPLMIIAAAYVDSHERLMKLISVLSLIALIPAAVGMLQWALSNFIGYREVMGWFYGYYAKDVTQQFTRFHYGGWFYRIPSTFAFVSQYFSFLMAMVAVTYINFQCQRDQTRRVLALAILIIILAASFLSGARGAILINPSILLLILLIDGRVVGFSASVVLVPFLMIVVLYLVGLNPILVIDRSFELAQTYSADHAVVSFLSAIKDAPLGLGTGMSTNPARYAFGESEESGLLVLESYYGKATIELGVVGLLVLLVLLFVIMLRLFRIRMALKDPMLKSVASGILAYVIMININGLKGSILDIDPANVYFWIFIGIALKLPVLDAQRAPHHQEQQVLAERYGVKTPLTPGQAAEFHSRK